MYVLLTKVQLTIKLREKETSFEPTEADNLGDRRSEALSTILPVKSRRYSHVHFQDKGLYIKMTYWYFTKS